MHASDPSGGLTRMTRQRAFEASHRYWVPTWSAEENWRRFGRTTSAYGHGHNYMASATLEGVPDPRTGMVMNLVYLDGALAAVTDALDHRFLNEECVDRLRGRQPSTEVLASVIWEDLQQRTMAAPFQGVRLAAVALAETDELWAEVSQEHVGMIRLTRSYSFSAAHVLARDDLDDLENRRIYGKCANPFGHGHDYRLDVSVRGEPDPVTGMVADLAALDQAVLEAILEPWDHRHFNKEVPPFDHLIPTSENVVRVAWDLLFPRVGPQLEKLTLHETPRGSFEYRPASHG